jgi:hypothetical protein
MEYAVRDTAQRALQGAIDEVLGARFYEEALRSLSS